MTQRIELRLRGTDLSGRSLAREIRARAVAAVASGESIELDFAGVRCASDSFLDELFGVLIQQKGKGWFNANVRVSNLDPATLRELLAVVQQRLGAPSAAHA